MSSSLLDHLTVDPESDRPPFEQVRLRIIELIADGTLLTGERLPTVRALAAHLDLAPNTVAKTYRELEAADVIETRGRSGSFIRAGRHDAHDAGFTAASTYVETARDLGLDDETIVALVQRALRAT
ncbi:GntR family transcriptional regulator [Gordonia rubripertincta]|uniref:GntR family transcriptional regulator n=1 Tax=Gordonia rubripertincta TaxID=36822 RepID=UPI000B8D68C5|nr:GntR family transcriptional regulator [Gordonia rubripertincta]ASR02292.1 HTH-type transcriptional repressor YtrA [Gordonia rubripertincta]